MSPSPRIARPPTGPPLVDPVEALRVVLLAASAPPRSETVCLLVDRDRRPLACIVVVGRGSVLPVADTMLLVARPGAGAVGREAPTVQVGAVVLASVRPGRGHRPDATDVRDWHRMRARFAAEGVDLLDWFLVDGAHAASLAELTDSPSHWRPTVR